MTARSRLSVAPDADGLVRRRFTVVEAEMMAEVGVLAPDERLELVDGDLVLMSPKGNRHELVKTALLERWYRLTSDACTLTPATTFRLSDDTYLEPDVVIYERAGGLKGLTGSSVLLVVEIADSSLRYDVGRKAALYARFGIRELWVIDAVRLTIRVFGTPTPDGYLEVRDYSEAELAVPRLAPDIFALELRSIEVE